jgi:hypothetical protein
MATPRHHDRIDYLRHAGKRKKVAHYLKATNFRKLAGNQVYGLRLQRRRLVLGFAAMAIVAIGLWFVFW